MVMTTRSESLSFVQDHTGVSNDTFVFKCVCVPSILLALTGFVALVPASFTDNPFAFVFFSIPFFGTPDDEFKGVVPSVTSSTSFFAGFAFTDSGDGCNGCNGCNGENRASGMSTVRGLSSPFEAMLGVPSARESWSEVWASIRCRASSAK